jgi:hypothetical protein
MRSAKAINANPANGSRKRKGAENILRGLSEGIVSVGPSISTPAPARD